jgi:hypothetical protein
MVLTHPVTYIIWVVYGFGNALGKGYSCMITTHNDRVLLMMGFWCEYHSECISNNCEFSNLQILIMQETTVGHLTCH